MPLTVVILAAGQGTRMKSARPKVVHELAGRETAEALVAMGRGLGGTLVSTRAATAELGLRRLQSLIGLSGPADAHAAARAIADSIELIVTVACFPDGKNRIAQVAEATVAQTGAPGAVDIIGYDPSTQKWTHSGVVPTFFPELQRRGIAVDAAMLAG